jgi:hypothetical protein
MFTETEIRLTANPIGPCPLIAWIAAAIGVTVIMSTTADLFNYKIVIHDE